MKRISSICGIIAAFALLLTAVSQAALIIGPGTTPLSSDLSVTDYISIQGDGTLSHTAGTLTNNSQWGMIVGQGGTGVNMFAYYTMSGSATYIGQSDIIGNAFSPWSVTGIWSLTDNASATLSGTLNFGNGQTSGNQLRLAGASAFTVGGLIGLDAANEYINFTSGSTATFTVNNLWLADYQTHVANGRILIDDVVQSDFSNFQVSNHTLSLATIPEPATLGLLGMVGAAMLLRRKLRG